MNAPALVPPAVDPDAQLAFVGDANPFIVFSTRRVERVVMVRESSEANFTDRVSEAASTASLSVVKSASETNTPGAGPPANPRKPQLKQPCFTLTKSCLAAAAVLEVRDSLSKWAHRDKHIR